MSKAEQKNAPRPVAAGEEGAYAQIVAHTKARFAQLDRPYAGEEVSAEIARRWAKHCKRKYDGPEPKTPADVPSMPFAPTAGDLEETPAVEERKPGALGKVRLPDDGSMDDEE